MKNVNQLALLLLLNACSVAAQDVTVSGPDQRLQVAFDCQTDGGLAYSVVYDGKTMLANSPLGLETNMGSFVKGLKLERHEIHSIDTVYEQSRIKASRIHYQANELTCHLTNAEGRQMAVTFRVSNNDVALRYSLPRQHGTGSVRIMSEATGFHFPEQTTTFLCPQSDAMIGWKRTKPSYEEEYKVDAPMSDRSQYGHGYTFPCLFRVGDEGWVLVSETGVDSRYCASHLSDAENGLYRIAFPMPEENNGNGTVEPAFALPGSTPWRTITVGESLKPIVETTVSWDLVETRYTTKQDYRMGRSTWSWILWQDDSSNFDDQVKYVDLAAALGYEYVLVDSWWDNNMGYQKMEKLVEKAREKCPAICGQVYPIRNLFFGETITVAGLVTGGDLISQLKGKDLGQRLLIPAHMLRAGERVFLDDVSLDDVERELGVPVTAVAQDGFELLDAICGLEIAPREAIQQEETEYFRYH